jgi:hypothetical protein
MDATTTRSSECGKCQTFVKRKFEIDQSHNRSYSCITDTPASTTPCHCHDNPLSISDPELPIMDEHRANCFRIILADSQGIDVSKIATIQNCSLDSVRCFHSRDNDDSSSQRPSLFTSDSNYDLCGGLDFDDTGRTRDSAGNQNISPAIKICVPHDLKNELPSLSLKGIKMTNISSKWRFGKMKIKEFVKSVSEEYLLRKVDLIFLAGRETLDEIGSVVISSSHTEYYQDSFAIFERFEQKVKSLPTGNEVDVELRTSRTCRSSTAPKVIYLASLKIHYSDDDTLLFLPFFFSCPKLPFFELAIYRLVVDINRNKGDEDDDKDNVVVTFGQIELW